ncbi:hypothetical protein INT45_003122 [Circinella minor]|uniref:Uncharacterized protein n=1 Tax=Circinella minor TaxID=1195481 RepID=A0A8H7RN60_9FUNG|nr:hypothetical protein INT45_003122 [Circinella minor]
MSSNNNTRRQQHADRMANINFRRLQDECSTLCAEYTAMRAQMDAMSSYMASIQQQQPPPPPSPNPVPEMDKQRVNDVIRNIHLRHALFADGAGFNYDETFRSRHNKEVTTVISSYCKGSPGGCVLDDKALHSQILMFFRGQKETSRWTIGQQAAIDQRKRRYKRVWHKLKARQAAHQKYNASLKDQYPDGEKLLSLECMSPEVSDAESEGNGLVRFTPSFRKPNVNDKCIVENFFGELDNLSKGGRKRKGIEAKERCVGRVRETPISEETVSSWPNWAK